ncbi:GNAT family N-acetyltransferase [Streptomyces caniferus]|uniref:N-acetyltransferase domain-containing protein n=1 Tax=Streptomyces caniferus TaxID=285557 RepID=A0A640S650_9ACTN|nr:GNAT family N-acetyltransferase [Streptomyces caniferus]GFE05095.1 hypothetical protein Scani_13630 [Streptomyces caniferus]
MPRSPLAFRTERLLLRRFTPDDAEPLVALHGDPDVMRLIDTGRPVPRTDVLQRTLPEFLTEPGHHPEDPVTGLGVWAAEAPATDAFIGWFALRPTTPGRPDEATNTATWSTPSPARSGQRPADALRQEAL